MNVKELALFSLGQKNFNALQAELTAAIVSEVERMEAEIGLLKAVNADWPDCLAKKDAEIAALREELAAKSQMLDEQVSFAIDLANQRDALREALNNTTNTLQAFSDYVTDEQMSTDGAVTYSTSAINHWAFLARAAIDSARGIK